MERAGIPGMAVGIVRDGRRDVYCFGVASTATGEPVGRRTLFEIGSVSKTFTATLAARAALDGRLSLSDPVSRHLPALRGSAFDAIRVIDLGTHTAGGLPLQVPDDVADESALMRWLRSWRPTTPPGTSRSYGNPGVGLLGLVAARALRADFVTAVERTTFPALGLHDTFLRVPADRRLDYAQGYTPTDGPVRMSPGVVADETYGVRTTVDDLSRWVAINLRQVAIDPRWQRAVDATRTGYLRVGAMTQDLIWEQYDEPVALEDLLAGNSARMGSEARPVVRIDPPSPPRQDVLIDKTGSTNGFSAYVAFVPARRTGVVLLANKRIPNEDRVAVAAGLLGRLGDDPRR